MEVQIIKSEKEYEDAITRLSQLMDLIPAAGSEEETELGLLTSVIEDYESGVLPGAKPTPIDAARDQRY